MTAGSMVSVFGGGGVESWFRFEHTVAERFQLPWKGLL
jgi:hypothetical protein